MKALVLAVVVAALCALAVPVAVADPALTGYPKSIASTGDSITRAFNTCSFPFSDCPAKSWSTGTDSTVNSHYRRILAANALISGRAYNDAKTGGKMVDLAGQVQSAVAQHAEYVTILMGANDVCTSSESAMTPVATLRSQLRFALATLSTGLPNARIFVASIPDVYHLWQILHTNFAAVVTWSLGGICQSLLAHPTSTSSTDQARRLRVRQRSIDDNAAIKAVCAQFIHCRWDGGAVFGTQFATSDVSTRDYFHPSLSGQTKLAALTWRATFDFTDAVGPTTTAATTPNGTGGSNVTLSAVDNVGVSGIEYRLGAATAWSRYTVAVAVPAGSSITFRAVDVNGNTEATQTLSL
ncbi:MAG: GDSL-type esterase/lipase family protein [Gaiellaceae bacterium]|jgi:lysophospholipase L1-like esterase